MNRVEEDGVETLRIPGGTSEGNKQPLWVTIEMEVKAKWKKESNPR